MLCRITVLALAALLANAPVFAQIGVLGDSESDEYRADDDRGRDEWKPHTLNWLELLVKFRGQDFGEWGTRSEPRRSGYAYNWARSGARASSIVNGGQHIGLAEQISAGDVRFAVIFIGANDWKPGPGLSDEIYSGELAGGALQDAIDAFVEYVTIAVDVLLAAGDVNVLVVSAYDPGRNPTLLSEFPDPARRARVSEAIESVNDGLIRLAQTRSNVEFLDLNSFIEDMVQRLTPEGFMVMAGHLVNAMERGYDPLHFQLADKSGHLSTIGSGLLANKFVQAFNHHWGLGIAPFSDQELIDIAFGVASTTDEQPPSVPTDLNAVPVDPTRINLSWSASTDNVAVAGYDIYRNGTQIAAETGTSYSDQSVVPGTTYEYRVVAYDAAGNVSGPSSPATATTPPDMPVQVLSLRAGWNMISTRMIADDMNIEAMFEPIIDDVFLVKDFAGRLYMPDRGINDILTWQVDEGYMVYVHSNTSLEIEGNPVEPESTPVDLLQGWNFIPYLRDSAQSVQEALESIENHLLVLKDYLGSIYLPLYGIDQIHSMQPGQGYQLFVLEPATLLYDANTGSGATKSTTAPQHEGIPASASLVLRGDLLEEGDSLTVRTGDGMVVGASTVSDGMAVITIRGDEPLTTDNREGANPGDVLEVLIEDGVSRNVDLGAVIDVLRNESVGEPLRYRNDAIWIADVAAVGTDEVSIPPASFALRQNYPNPFNPETQIEFSLNTPGSVRLSVYNPFGQLVDVLMDRHVSAGVHTVTFDARGLSSGIYFYRMETNAGTITRSMLLLK